MKRTDILLLASLLGGCAAPSLYQWGGYDSVVYQSYATPERAAELLVQLEKHVVMLESRNMRVAPGMYGDLGTMYLQAGKREAALTYYRKERDNWPESRVLMEAMIKSLESKATEGVKS